MRRYSRSYKPFSIRRNERKARNRIILSIFICVILGYALLNWILPLFISGLSLINKFRSGDESKAPTTIDTTIAPPVLNIPYEATNSAVIRIPGYTTPNTKVEIYLDNDLKSSITSNDEGKFISEDIRLNLGNNSFSGKTINEENRQSLSSKPIKIIYDNEKPKLEISSPNDNQEFKGEKRINVAGSTDTTGNITVTVNGARLIVDSDGNFSQRVELNDGENNLSIIATDPAGNTTQVSRKVTYTP